MCEQSEYERGWRDGYGQGRDDEADDLDLREPPEQRQRRAPRDRQMRDPGRDR